MAIEINNRSKYVIPAQAGIQSLSPTQSGFLLPQESVMLITISTTKNENIISHNGVYNPVRGELVEP